MSGLRTIRRASDRESGYALLLVVFLAALMLIAAVAAVPNLLTAGKREKEEELIWRGQQYARAVRLYQRKMNRLPQSLDDLTQAKNLMRFLRKPYTDPMNAEDGSWRLITVGPAGQIIGSVKQRGAIALGGAQPGRRPAGRPGPSVEVEMDAEAPGLAPRGVQRSTTGAMAPASSSDPKPEEPFGEPVQGRVIGASIVGVGSKVNRESIRVYDGATTYREWEFLWDPSREAPGVGTPVAPGRAPARGRPPVPPRRPL